MSSNTTDVPAVGATRAAIVLTADAAPLHAALVSLELAAKTSPEIFEHFFSGLDSLVELCRIDHVDLSASGAGEVRIFFQPSDRLRDFLAAVEAGELKLHLAGV